MAYPDPLSMCRAIPIAHALDRLLDEIELTVDEDWSGSSPASPDLLPVSCGIPTFDRLLGGGVTRGQVVWVEADLRHHAKVLAHEMAHWTRYRCLLDSNDILESAVLLLASASGLPGCVVRAGQMSEREWRALAEGVGTLAGREFAVSSAGTTGGLRRAVDEYAPDLLVVSEPDRLGPVGRVAEDLCELALTADVGVVAVGTGGSSLDLGFQRGNLRRALMASCHFGGSAVVMTADREDLARVEWLRVDPQRARVQ